MAALIPSLLCMRHGTMNYAPKETNKAGHAGTTTESHKRLDRSKPKAHLVTQHGRPHVWAAWYIYQASR